MQTSPLFIYQLELRSVNNSVPQGKRIATKHSGIAKKDGFTKFEISNSFQKNLEVFPEPYTSRSKAVYHQVKVDFFIVASNNYGKSSNLILQREFFISSSDKTVVIQKAADAANDVLKSVSII
ncbi:MAG: hypothetical protein H0V82_00470 [Candidatus Protochlamydia sp.]|nr:hypothetical protein [Candidatus Protochlamydia sp.]